MSDPVIEFRILLETMIKAIVDASDLVDVRIRQGEQTSVYEVRCAKSDVGKVLGKKGQMISAFRRILMSYAMKHQFRAIIEVIE